MYKRTNASTTTEIARLKDAIVRAHRKWIAANPSATLADLRRFLEEVDAEFDGFDDDDLIADHLGDLGAAANYLNEWADPTTDGEEKVTFEYRRANLDEDMDQVHELIELIGEMAPLKKLGRP